MNRREFVKMSMVSIAGIVATNRCGTKLDTSDSSSDKSGSVSSNHGHTAKITAAQLDDGSAVSINIQGTSSHSHTLTLSASEMSSIKAGTQVSQVSSANSGHTHSVTFN